MDARDIKISRKLQKLARRCAELAAKEFGEPVGLTLMVHPYTDPGKTEGIREFQYISTLERDHMYRAMSAIVEKWKRGEPDVVPHERT